MDKYCLIPWQNAAQKLLILAFLSTLCPVNLLKLVRVTYPWQLIKKPHFYAVNNPQFTAANKLSVVHMSSLTVFSHVKYHIFNNTLYIINEYAWLWLCMVQTASIHGWRSLMKLSERLIFDLHCSLLMLSSQNLQYGCGKCQDSAPVRGTGGRAINGKYDRSK